VAVPSEGEERVVADGRSQLLLIQPFFSENPGSITRINLDGSVDRSFGVEGTVHIAGEDAVVTPDGKILVATASHPGESAEKSDARVTRLLPDGKPDPSFGTAGNVNVYFGRSYDYGETIALAANGDILLGGIRVNHAVNRGEGDYSLAVARLKSDGSLDCSFGRKGVGILPGGGEIEAFDIAPTPSGGVVFEGGNEIEAFFWKLTRDGSVDRHFGQQGFLELRKRREKPGYHEELLVAPRFAVLPSGKLLLAATGSPNRGPRQPGQVVAIRLRPDGRVDRSYGDDGWAFAKGSAETSAEGMTLLPGGAVAIATTFVGSGSEENRDFGATAFSPDGHSEHGFGKHGRSRARLAGRQEALGVIDVGGRAVVLGHEYAGPRQWLLDCPPVSRP
jgi:uncharacterized delta-60 repeat protein